LKVHYFQPDPKLSLTSKHVGFASGKGLNLLALPNCRFEKKTMAGSLSPKGMHPICQSPSKAEKMMLFPSKMVIVH
jgi:hypothetical protein